LNSDLTEVTRMNAMVERLALAPGLFAAEILSFWSRF
jgi:hypothetical protein